MAEETVTQETKVEEVVEDLSSAPVNLEPPVLQPIEEVTSESSEEKTDAEGKEKAKKALSEQDKIDKRIAEVVAKKYKAERERDEYKDKVDSLSKEVESLKTSTKAEKSYTDADLYGAMKQAAQDGEWEIFAKANKELVNNALKADRKAKEDEARVNESSKQRDNMILSELVNDFPEIKDPNGQFRQTAEKILAADETLQKRGNYGLYQAAVRAKNILVEMGVIGPAMRKQVKQAMKHELGSGSP